jgi:hypothetical protein
MMNGTTEGQLQLGVRTEFCETHLFLGKPNDHLEGFNNMLSQGNGIANSIMKIPATPALRTGFIRPTSIYMKIKVDVLSDLEPNGEDLTKIDPRVGTKTKILIEKTGRFGGIYSALGLSVITLLTCLVGF